MYYNLDSRRRRQRLALSLLENLYTCTTLRVTQVSDKIFSDQKISACLERALPYVPYCKTLSYTVMAWSVCGKSSEFLLYFCYFHSFFFEKIFFAQNWIRDLQLLVLAPYPQGRSNQVYQTSKKGLWLKVVQIFDFLIYRWRKLSDRIT